MKPSKYTTFCLCPVNSACLLWFLFSFLISGSIKYTDRTLKKIKKMIFLKDKKEIKKFLRKLAVGKRSVFLFCVAYNKSLMAVCVSKCYRKL